MEGENFEEPKSVNEVLYFTRRPIKSRSGEKGFLFMWVPRVECPKCKNGLLKKPKKRAKHYECEKCGNEVEDLGEVMAYVKYTCPYCKNELKIKQIWKKPFSFKCVECEKVIKVPSLKKNK